MKPRRVLVPLDGTELSSQLISSLERLLPPTEYDVILLRMASPLPENVMAAPGPQTERHLKATLQGEMAELACRLADVGYCVATVARLAEPVEAIAALTEEIQVDLVVLATHQYAASQHAIAAALAHLSLPVMLLEPIAHCFTSDLTERAGDLTPAALSASYDNVW
jgi:nucleotide-binding universal stress UspA family protein